jgi:GNAT superfamily N-acetyltransferase
MSDLKFRFAEQQDVKLLAEMNQQLILDEKHRNKMILEELEKRMSGFLKTEYTAVIASCGENDIGYALYRRDPDWIYLRQLFVGKGMRRKGIGRALVEWLKGNEWRNAERIRVEVLAGNSEGISFWKALGFKEYCITMEMANH